LDAIWTYLVDRGVGLFSHFLDLFAQFLRDADPGDFFPPFFASPLFRLMLDASRVDRGVFDLLRSAADKYPDYCLSRSEFVATLSDLFFDDEL
jgi:hypothetical protein